MKDNFRIFNYYVSMLDLSGELCLQRNYKGIKILEKIFSIDLCINMLRSSELPLIIWAKMAKLILHLYCDREPMEELILPQYTCIWNPKTLLDVRIPKSKLEGVQYFNIIKRYFKEFFEDPSNKTIIISNWEWNYFIYRVLCLFENILKMGAF